MAKKRLSPRFKQSTKRNFEQYRLKGMIAQLHAMYYDHRHGSHELLNNIGIAIDQLTALCPLIREDSDGIF